MINGWTIREDLSSLHGFPDPDYRCLGDAGILVRPLELDHFIDIKARIVSLASLFRIGTDDDPGGIDTFYYPFALRLHHITRITRNHSFHTGSDQRGLRLQQRHRLPLHVRAHQCTVGVIVLKKRHQRRGHADDLLRRDVHVFDFIGGGRNKISA